MNSINVIHPYSDGGSLVFDDPAVSLVKEALVGGTDFILEMAARSAGADPARFTLVFAAIPFPGHQMVATWIEKGECGIGDWYTVNLANAGMANGWLCPALLKYFQAAPGRIYFQIKPHERIPA